MQGPSKSSIHSLLALQVILLRLGAISVGRYAHLGLGLGLSDRPSWCDIKLPNSTTRRNSLVSFVPYSTVALFLTPFSAPFLPYFGRTHSSG